MIHNTIVHHNHANYVTPNKKFDKPSRRNKPNMCRASVAFPRLRRQQHAGYMRHTGYVWLSVQTNTHD